MDRSATVRHLLERGVHYDSSLLRTTKGKGVTGEVVSIWAELEKARPRKLQPQSEGPRFCAPRRGSANAFRANTRGRALTEQVVAHQPGEFQAVKVRLPPIGPRPREHSCEFAANYRGCCFPRHSLTYWRAGIGIFLPLLFTAAASLIILFTWVRKDDGEGLPSRKASMGTMTYPVLTKIMPPARPSRIRHRAIQH
jgi:hypothetical protein